MRDEWFASKRSLFREVSQGGVVGDLASFVTFFFVFAVFSTLKMEVCEAMCPQEESHLTSSLFLFFLGKNTLLSEIQEGFRCFIFSRMMGRNAELFVFPHSANSFSTFAHDMISTISENCQQS